MGDPKPQAGSLLLGFGGEKGLEDIFYLHPTIGFSERVCIPMGVIPHSIGFPGNPAIG